MREEQTPDPTGRGRVVYTLGQSGRSLCVNPEGRARGSRKGKLMELLIVSVSTTLVVSFLCSLSEAALLSMPRTELVRMAKTRPNTARIVEQFKANIHCPIAVILVLNTLAHTMGASIGGGEFAVLFGDRWLLLFSLGFSAAMIQWTEILPKSLGYRYSAFVVATIAQPLASVIQLFRPLLWVTHVLNVPFEGKRATGREAITEEEINALIEQGLQAGTFERAEQDMVENVFRLGDRTVGALMTPRTDIAWVDLDDPDDETRRRIVACPYSRMPVGHGGLDRVVGTIRAKDLLSRILAGGPFDLRASMRQPFLVPDTMRALKALEAFRKAGRHMALVVDEHGGVEGVITLNDILAGIVGDVPAAGQDDPPRAVRREDGSWLMDGALPVDDFKELLQLFKELLQLEELPNEERSRYQTLAGFVITHLGTIPAEGESFEWNGHRFEIVDMDGRRVDKVLVRPG